VHAARLALLGLGALLAACAAPVPRLAAQMPAPAPAPPQPVSPFSDSPISLLVHGPFVRGEHVVVRVCLHADRSIASSSILQSSGDRRFDELALGWARRVRLRPITDGRPVYACGPVRVELRDSTQPAFGGASEQFG
jgi:TonB family protein